jgi:hypothetical protein
VSRPVRSRREIGHPAADSALQIADFRSIGQFSIGVSVCAAATVYASLGTASPAKIWMGSLAVGIGALFVASNAVPRAERRDRKFILFGVMLPIYLGISMGLTALSFASGRPERALADSGDVAEVYPLVMLGLLGWWVGYRLGVSRSARSAALSLGALFARADIFAISSRRTATLFAVASGARVLLLQRSAYGYLEDSAGAIQTASVLDEVLGIVAGFAPLALLLMALKAFHPTRGMAKDRVYLALGIPVEACFTILSGQKSPFLFFGLSLALAGVTLGRIRWKQVAGLAAVGVVLIFPLNDAYRALLRPGPGVQPASGPPSAILGRALGETLTVASTDPAFVPDALLSSTDRLRGVDAFAGAVIAHQQGLAYDSPTAPGRRVLLLLVPRALWPGKPIDLYSLSISRDYFGRSDQILTSSTLTVFGDSYRYGGPLAVIAGLGYLGFLCRMLDTAFDPRRSLTLLLPLLAALPILRQGDLAAMSVGILRTYLLLIPTLWILGSRRAERQPK